LWQPSSFFLFLSAFEDFADNGKRERKTDRERRHILRERERKRERERRHILREREREREETHTEREREREREREKDR